MPVKPIPEGYSAVTPILMANDGDALVEFMKRAFDAKEHQVTRRADGKIVHADVTIAGAHIMVTESTEQPGAAGAAVNLYVPDTDATYRRALAAGATSIMAPSDRFYGDRNAVVKDGCGILWSLATHIEDVPPEELKRREAEAVKRMAEET